MGIYPNAYYNYLEDRKAEYHRTKEHTCNVIRDIYHECSGSVGHRFMKAFLERKNIYLSKATVHKYMNREMHLYSICRRKKPDYRKGHPHKLFPNLLKQDFTANEPNRVWCTDFTYLYLNNGTVRYNCTIIDLYDRSVVASENGKYITSDLAVRTLDKAIHAQHCDATKLILHSDQGVQFASIEFTSFCRMHGITQSMSRAGCPYDNAPMERYYNTLKAEEVYIHSYDTVQALDDAVYEFAYVWYNRIRPHSYNGYMTPAEKRFG
jgi:putative transposase